MSGVGERRVRAERSARPSQRKTLTRSGRRSETWDGSCGRKTVMAQAAMCRQWRQRSLNRSRNPVPTEKRPHARAAIVARRRLRAPASHAGGSATEAECQRYADGRSLAQPVLEARDLVAAMKVGFASTGNPKALVDRSRPRRHSLLHFFSVSGLSCGVAGALLALFALTAPPGVNGNVANMVFAWFCICSCICTNMFFDCSM